IHEPYTDAGRRRLREFAPVPSRLGGAPDSLLRHHPAEAVVQEKQGNGLIVQRRLCPVGAAIRRRQRDRFPAPAILNHADNDSATGRWELHIADREHGLGLIVEVLHLPLLRVHAGRCRGQQEYRACKRQGGHRTIPYFITTGPEDSTRSTWFADS